MTGASDFPQLLDDGFSGLDINDDVSSLAGPSHYPRSLLTSSTDFLPPSDYGFSGLDINDGVASSASPSYYAHSLATSSRAPLLPYINPLHYTNDAVGSGHREQLFADQTQHSPSKDCVLSLQRLELTIFCSVWMEYCQPFL